MLIIGCSDALGAWRIQNSEGTAWGDNGYVWMDYVTFSVLAVQVDGFYFA
jgi:C1A family cysteine protease